MQIAPDFGDRERSSLSEAFPSIASERGHSTHTPSTHHVQSSCCLSMQSLGQKDAILPSFCPLSIFLWSVLSDGLEGRWGHKFLSYLLTQRRPRAHSPSSHVSSLSHTLAVIDRYFSALCAAMCSLLLDNKECQSKRDVSLWRETGVRTGNRRQTPARPLQSSCSGRGGGGTNPPLCSVAALLISCFTQASWTGSQRRCSVLDAWSC